MRVANMPLADCLDEWLRATMEMVHSRVMPYFASQGLCVKDVTGDEINEFYLSLRKEGLTGATAQRHHSLLHLAFRSAVKRRIIPTNPCDQADRPKANQYIGSYYNADELKTLIEALNDDPMRIPVILTAYYGLRRSEVLGIKWDAIDYKDKKIYIRHKIIEVKMPNGKVLEGMDVMKTKSFYRTLALIPYIEGVLKAEAERQEKLRKVMRGAYNKAYSEYVCVDAMGNLLKPQYITEHTQHHAL